MPAPDGALLTTFGPLPTGKALIHQIQGETGAMRQRWWLVVAAFVACMGVTVLPAGAQLPVPTPTVPTPTVPTPTVPTPTVTVPTVSTPAVTTPTPPPVSAPAVPVHVPSVTVPSVTTPSVSTPAATVQSTSTPSVSTPSVNTSGTATGRSGNGSTGSGTSGSSGASGTSGSSGSAGVSGSGASGTSGASGSTPGGATSPSGTTGADGQSPRSGASEATPRTRAGRVRQRERNLRRTVLRLRGCLAGVPRSERRVLSLRAGVGRLRPHTRSEVARITHLRRARVVTLERRGLRKLRALNRAGACQDAGAPATAAAAAPGSATTVPPAGGAGQRSAVLAEHHSSVASRDAGSQRKPERAQLSISRPATSGPSSFDLALILGPLAFLAFLLVIAREVRRTG